MESIGKQKYSEVLARAKEQYNKLPIQKFIDAEIYKSEFEYYLMGTYPPLKSMRPINEELVLQNASDKFDLYIHIPFCQQYCTFCHFAKEINAKDNRIEKYLDALHKEITLISNRLNKPKIRTLFFGGGTPSILKPKQISKLFDKLYKEFSIEADAEISFELHPGLIRHADYEERLKILKQSGVSRWVSGVQSMDDRVLKKLNRGHNAKEVLQLIEMLNKNDIYNISLDLMYGLPYQTHETWYKTIYTLLDAGIEKFNIFPLMLKITDPIMVHYMKDKSIFPTQEEKFTAHFIADDILQNAGFKKGPVLYYAKSNHHSLQQESKFDVLADNDLIPLGVSSFGYIGNTQYYNMLKIDDYIESLNKGMLPIFLGKTNNIDEQMRRTVMFGLRSKGVSRTKFFKKYGIDPYDKFPREFDKLVALDLIEDRDDYITLNSYGSLFIDGISLLFVSDEIINSVQEYNRNNLNNPRENLIEKHDFTPIQRIDYKQAEKHFTSIKSHKNSEL